MRAALPQVEGVFTAEQCRQTAESIAHAQRPDGALPWFDGGHTDPWDHVQNAMALDVAGFTDEALRAYEWSVRSQRPDGTWAAKYENGDVTDAKIEANFCAYLATGVWHHWTLTRDEQFVARMWPTVRRGIDAVLRLQSPDGEIFWTTDSKEALLTGNASMQLSLRCAVALGELVGELVPGWELAAQEVRHAIEAHRDRFADKSRYSMDWYYPILAGVLRGERAEARLAERWDDFVVPGLGIRCVDDHPWVTGAETCEFVLALEAVGRRDDALEQFAAMQHLRDPDGSYWTGLVFTDGKRWPVEQSTWTAATVILAADALSRTTAGNGLFRGDGLAAAPTTEGTCTCRAPR